MSYNADYTREYFAIMESLQGDVPGRRAAYKKATVTLTEDSKTIELFEGMV